MKGETQMQETTGAFLGDQAAALAKDRRSNERALMLLVLPAIVVILTIVLIPMLWLAWQSILDQNGNFSLQHYRDIFNEPVQLDYLKNTFVMSAAVTIICALLAYPVSYVLILMPAWAVRWSMIFVIVPLLTSVLVRTYAWLVILGRKGILNDVLIGLGIADKPFALVYNYTGTIIGMVHVMIPMIVLPLYASMRAIDPDYMKAAASLGATPSRAFQNIFFPLSLSGLLAGVTIIFVLCLGYFVTPSILGGGKVVVWAIFVEQTVSFNPLWGPAAAAGLLLLMITILVLVVARTVAGINIAPTRSRS